ncbi:hypothetical protein HA402_011881 [Bradysia odoriphaga]|nr:hypothetical protein HA402_011881 [Bradysia odoriphaga]
MENFVAGVMPGVMPGVTRQAIGIHSGNAVSLRSSRSVDRRDYSSTPCEEPHYFDCTKVVHYTENASAALIATIDNEEEPFCFKAKPWRITRTTSLNLSWWSPHPHFSWKDQLDHSLPNIWLNFEDIGNSSALNGRSFCGPIGFAIEWEDILEQYAISRQTNIDDIELRTLGTFRYRAEIMYAVLVCVRGDTGVEQYPIIGAGGTEAFELGTNREYFTWKVYSTVGFTSRRNGQVDWTWDHLAFGFHCPTSDLIIEPRLCDITHKISTKNMPSSRSRRDEIRAQEAMVAPEQLLFRLRRKTVSRFFYSQAHFPQ